MPCHSTRSCARTCESSEQFACTEAIPPSAEPFSHVQLASEDRFRVSRLQYEAELTIGALAEFEPSSHLPTPSVGCAPIALFRCLAIPNDKTTSDQKMKQLAPLYCDPSRLSQLCQEYGLVNFEYNTTESICSSIIESCLTFTSEPILDANSRRSLQARPSGSFQLRTSPTLRSHGRSTAGRVHN